ncbi:MAG: rRNA pseudouridine synthase [Clostridiales bacterium]|nr:rRNA pseudouridine synthase [Clostridiales bacterium]
MRQRVQKIIAQAGLCSRRTAEEWMLCGRVTVNGTAARPGAQADPDTDCILVDGKPLRGREENVYLMLHKPRGYVTTLSDEFGRKTAAELVRDCGVRVFPVGRLDRDSEGLLLFTNDGALTQRLLHPSHQVDKVYIVSVSGADEGSAGRLRAVTSLDGQPIAPAQVDELYRRGDRAEYRIVIHQGKKRQIRRMCAAVGLTVTRLCRIAEGGLELGALPPGRWRYLTAGELESIKGSD